MADNKFDLKRALSGEAVIIDGDRCTICGLRSREEFPLVFKAESKDTYYLDLEGRYRGEVVTMAPRKVKKTVFVNLYGSTPTAKYSGEFSGWSSEEAAKSHADPKDALATAVPVEIEVEE